jgi:dihydrolipoamide dehydrogenase
MLVIGSGPAGITAALEAAELGSEVTLIGAEPVGGRANWHSLLPSKVLLTAADHLEEADHHSALGLAGTAPEPELPILRARVTDEAERWSQHQHERLKQRGVTVVTGNARFLDEHHIQLVKQGDIGEILELDHAIVATGSVPVFLPDIKPDGQRILAPRLVATLESWPEHLIVIGGGVTGAEFAYFFRRMDAQVTWVTDLDSMLPRCDTDLTSALEDACAMRGIAMVKSSPVQAVRAAGERVVLALGDGRTLEGSHAFIAMGRKPDLENLGLEAAGLAYTSAGITVDKFGRTTQPHIYAAGDATGPPFVANRGQAQARVGARHALAAPTAAFRPETVIEAIYTSPQVAQVGLTEATATAAGLNFEVHRTTYDQALKPRLAATSEGFVKVLVDPEGGRILGGACFGDRAAEVLSSVCVAIAGGMTRTHLCALFLAHPTLGELVTVASRGY